MPRTTSPGSADRIRTVSDLASAVPATSRSAATLPRAIFRLLYCNACKARLLEFKDTQSVRLQAPTGQGLGEPGASLRPARQAARNINSHLHSFAILDLNLK